MAEITPPSPSTTTSTSSPASPVSVSPSLERPIILLLVRHGRTHANEQRIFQGQKVFPLAMLTDEGRQQADEVGRLLHEYYAIDRLYCSDLDRARDTARVIQAHTGGDLIEDVRLREMGLGVCEGQPLAVLAEKYHHDVNSVPGAETRAQLDARTLVFLYDLQHSLQKLYFEQEKTWKSSQESPDTTDRTDDIKSNRGDDNNDDGMMQKPLVAAIVSHGGCLASISRHLAKCNMTNMSNCQVSRAVCLRPSLLPQAQAIAKGKAKTKRLRILKRQRVSAEAAEVFNKNSTGIDDGASAAVDAVSEVVMKDTSYIHPFRFWQMHACQWNLDASRFRRLHHGRPLSGHVLADHEKTEDAVIAEGTEDKSIHYPAQDAAAALALYPQAGTAIRPRKVDRDADDTDTDEESD